MQQCAQVEELMMPLTSVGYMTLKTTVYFKRGLQPCSDPTQMNDAWLTSHFKIDFILSLSRSSSVIRSSWLRSPQVEEAILYRCY